MTTAVARGWGVKLHGKPIPWFSEWKCDALCVNEGRAIRVVITEEAEYRRLRRMDRALSRWKGKDILRALKQLSHNQPKGK